LNFLPLGRAGHAKMPFPAITLQTSHVLQLFFFFKFLSSLWNRGIISHLDLQEPNSFSPNINRNCKEQQQTEQFKFSTCQDPILRLLNLQLQLQRCSRLFKVELKFSTLPILRHLNLQLRHQHCDRLYYSNF
jgi:hypothetical protein